jgi:hypothetical protein
VRVFNDDEDTNESAWDGPFYRGDVGGDGFPSPSHPGVMTIETLRNEALRLFGVMLAQQTGVKQTVDIAPSEEKHQFLSIQETENIVRTFCANDNGEMMAVGGNSKAEAMQQIRSMMEALIQRIMSNLVSEGVRRELIDVSFNSDMNDFAFEVSERGRKLVDHYSEFFDEPVDRGSDSEG